MVDRSSKLWISAFLSVPLMCMEARKWEDRVPLCREGIPIDKPGSCAVISSLAMVRYGWGMQDESRLPALLPAAPYIFDENSWRCCG